MKPSSGHRLFIIAAWFNWLVGAPMLVASGFTARLMGLQVNITAMLFMQITAGVVVAFGIAYWMIARDPVRYRPYISLGLGLKVFLAGLVYAYWISGQIPWPLPALATFDLVFAWFFWRYLRANPLVRIAADSP
jgi:hypothetical protein